MSKVEWKKLGDICKLERGVRVVKKDLQEDGVIPVYQNSLTPLGYYEKSNYPKNTPFVICAGAAGDVGFCEKPFWAADDCTCVITSNSMNSRYIFYLLQRNQHLLKSQVRKASVPRLSKDVIGKICVPILPLPEQNRIVGILDTFTASIDNLKEQIAQRRKQYEYYRDQLLDLEGKEGVEMKTIGDIAKYRRGSFPQPYGNKEWYDGEGAMPFVQVADVEENVMRLKKNTKQFISRLAMPKSVFAPIGTIIVTLQGSIGKVAITQYDSYIDRTLGIFESFTIDINKKYFALQLEKIFAIKKEKARGGTIKTITKEEFTNFIIPLPPIEEQQRIVSILDTFEASIQNMEAQLAQREKQYEYYRNKLLTFE